MTMRVLGVLVVMAAGMGLTACLPVLLPPGRADASVGGRFGVRDAPATASTTTPDTTSGRTPIRRPAVSPAAPSAAIFRVSGGLHLASLVPPDRVLVDAGAGYVFNDIGWGDRKIHGLYAEVSPIMARGDAWWLYFTARGEAMFPDGRTTGAGYAFLGRLSLETRSFTDNSAGSAAVSKDGLIAGLAYGTLGIGAFVEAGAQRLPGGQEAGILLGGISLRFPAAFGVYCCFIPKK